jgi:mRNA-degrading endonuclease toxin of MazEF toxin-antitoxin module
LQVPSVVAANLIQTLDWRERQVKKAAEAEPGVIEQVQLRLITLIGADCLLNGPAKQQT